MEEAIAKNICFINSSIVKFVFFLGFHVINFSKKLINTMAVVGFEPTPPERLVPKTSSLDHSATLPMPNLYYCNAEFKINILFCIIGWTKAISTLVVKTRNHLEIMDSKHTDIYV